MTVPALLLAAVLIPQPVEFVELPGVCRQTEVTDRTDASVPSEGYRLEVTTNGIVVVSSDAAGAFYARQTLKQLAETRDGKTVYPCCRIVDSPAYGWRSVMIDEARHFMGKETVKRLIDLLAMHKFNRLHWHLTDDQGWRIDIPHMPELVRYGARRAQSPAHGAVIRSFGNFRFASTELNGCPYGPYFYTRAELDEIVAYAAARHVEIVPEVDVPGHFMSALAAHPEFACDPAAISPREPMSDWGISTNVLCIGNADAVRFVEKIYDYVCEVFPSKVIHVGGDEVPRIAWERCPKCRAKMKAEGMKDARELQSWLMRHLAEYLEKKGRRLMGWEDDVMGGEMPKSAIAQTWRVREKKGGSELGVADLANGTEKTVAGGAAETLGHDVVMSPHSQCYYNYKAGLAEDPFQSSQWGRITLADAYAFSPMVGHGPSSRPHVLGAEICCWTEYIWNEYDLAWKLWPRTCAMAEVLWSDPKPRDFDAFAKRAAIHRRRLIGMGVNCQPVME